MVVDGDGGYSLPTTNIATLNHEIQFATGSGSSEPLAGLTGLYLKSDQRGCGGIIVLLYGRQSRTDRRRRRWRTGHT